MNRHVLPTTSDKWRGPGQCAGSTALLLYVDDVVILFSFGELCKLYADAMKLYSIIQTRQDVNELQSSLDASCSFAQSMATHNILQEVSSVMPWSN